LAEAGFVLNRAEIDRLLDISIGDAIRDARAVLPGFDELSGPRQRAFANMAFNLGRQRLARFVKMTAAAKRHDWCEVSRQMLDSKWARQVGPRADRLAEMVLEDG
jgi:lysozyme